METTVAQKLEFLMELQAIDSQMDEFRKIRGDLPEEVRDLEDEIAGYETRINRFKQEVGSLKDEITKYKNSIKDAEKLIKKYEEQQMNVRNNREYDAISKEVETQQLDIQIFEKRIKEATLKIDQKNLDIEAIQNTLEERTKDLDTKKQELDVIIAETKAQEEELQGVREEAAAKIEERLLFSYNRLRNNYGNGLAVVAVRRGACGGCFNMVPPQRQAEIRERKKIIVCEHCGRIMASVEYTNPEDNATKVRAIAGLREAANS